MSNRDPDAPGTSHQRWVLRPVPLASCTLIPLAVWAVVSLVAGPSWRVTAAFVGSCCILVGVGLTLLRAVGPVRGSPELQLLALPTGLTAVAAAAQIAGHLSIPLILVL